MYVAENTSRGARVEDGEAVEARSVALPPARLRLVRRSRRKQVAGFARDLFPAKFYLSPSVTQMKSLTSSGRISRAKASSSYSISSARLMLRSST